MKNTMKICWLKWEKQTGYSKVKKDSKKSVKANKKLKN